MPKVTIIIPVYNVERYLEQCLDSAINQTLKDIEIICVNDGSTDNSLRILESFQKKDSRVKIINKNNAGYGNTMNVGLDNATGKYIVFLESDDMILPDMCLDLYDLCELNKLEMVKCDFYEFKMVDGVIYKKYMNLSYHDNYNRIMDSSSEYTSFFAAVYTWTGMYKTEFLNENNIRHNETSGASYQDIGFWFQTLMRCKKAYFLNQAFYMYRQDNPDSSIHSKEKLYAFTNEYEFVRKKMIGLDQDNKLFLKVSAFFSLQHDIVSLCRVDKTLTNDLLELIRTNFYHYSEKDENDISLYHDAFSRQLLMILASSSQTIQRIHEYLDKDIQRKSFISAYNRVILYGAGIYAEKVLDIIDLCKLWDREIMCGITMPDGQNDIKGIPIVKIDDLVKYKEDALVIVCASHKSEYCKDMYVKLAMLNFENIVHADELLIKNWWQ